MKFFHFHQNNSFGRWKGPAINLVVRAANAEEANAKAEEAGAYFDGVGDGVNDCECCGNRWHRVEEYDADDKPRVYTDVIEVPDLDKEFKDEEEDLLYVP